MCRRALDVQNALSNYSERLLRVKMTKLSNRFRLFESYTVIHVDFNGHIRFQSHFTPFSPFRMG